MRPAPRRLGSTPTSAPTSPRAARAGRLVLALVFAPLCGCFGLCEPAPPDPCDLDPLGCDDNTSHLEVDPSCPLVGDLEVAIGEGEGALHLLAAGARPTIHYGAQGGVHLALGVRVDDFAAGYPGLEIEFSAQVGPCEVDDLECAWTDLGARHLVVTDDDLWTVTSGVLETTGYIVVLDGDPEWYGEGEGQRAVIRAEVKDRCGRVGTAVHDYLISGGATGTGGESEGDTDGV